MSQAAPIDLPFIFGIRHLSPASAWHLLSMLEARQPKYILLEAPSDSEHTLLALGDLAVRPPIAMLGYTEQLPVVSALYPLAEYSPEFQLVRWVLKHRRTLKCIDLPMSVSLASRQQKIQAMFANDVDNPELIPHADEDSKGITQATPVDYYQAIATAFDEPNYDSYWERYFEHETETSTFVEHLKHWVKQSRPLGESQDLALSPDQHAHNRLRESYMLSQIQAVMKQGIPADDILVVVGAYHVPAIESGLRGEADGLIHTEAELNELPSVSVRQVLMPYSYHRLSQQSGYGAGNHAPYYFEMLWQARLDQRLDELPAWYASTVAHELRHEGQPASPASVIEVVRLAQALRVFRPSPRPILRDLEDAVKTVFGDGDLQRVVRALTKINHGTRLGHVPDGLSRTPLQDDFKRSISLLKLDDFYSPEPQLIRLDLRENRQVKRSSLAWLDLNRSTFFHRLVYLGIQFPSLRTSSATSDWIEEWRLQWSVESEIALAETSLKGESIEYATSFALREALLSAQHQDSVGVSIVAQVVEQACLCQLPAVFVDALTLLQSMAIEHVAFKEAIDVAQVLSKLIQYGSWRPLDVSVVPPLLQQVFTRACLLFEGQSHCDDRAARELLPLVSVMEALSQRHLDCLPIDLWQEVSHRVAFNDQVNSLVSGVCFSLLLENNRCDDDELTQELSRRLSVGNPVSLAALWFEGLATRNRFGLLSRASIWEALDDYLAMLDEPAFLYALVALRRTFSEFDLRSIHSLSSLLAQYWKKDEEVLAEVLQSELTENERKQLDELNDFDFDF